MSLVERLRQVPLFAELDEADLARVCGSAYEMHLDAGETLFEEGDPGDNAYLIASGEIEISAASGARRVVLSVRRADDVIGEMSLLQEAPRLASARARTDADLVVITKRALDDLIDSSPTAARQLFGAVLDRWRSRENALRGRERMAQLGTLTAGLAHELNNPAAAVRSGVAALRPAIERLGRAQVRASGLGLDDHRQVDLAALVGRAAIARPSVSDPLGRSRREDELGERLEELGADEPWEMAAALVDVVPTADYLDTLIDGFGPDALIVLELVAEMGSVGILLRQVGEGADRMGAIIQALKSYSYLDRAPIQAVDVRVGLDDTLLILKRKLDGIAVHREYASGTPVIQAYGADLNQVWTNLIDNAADALRETETPGAEITLRVAPGDDGGVVVEVADNGPGIPDDVRDRIFDPFFTTKEPGRGTGLGLDISRGIVVEGHGGDISADSGPAGTVMRVVLPPHPPA